LKMNCFVTLLLLLGLSTTVLAKPRDVILTTDCGTEIDDQWALVYLFLSPEINVKGIVGTHAPNIPSAESSASCARDVLKRLHAASPPPVFAGSDVPLKTLAPLRNSGVEFMVRTARAYSKNNRLVILTTGATTDVASALLEDPAVADRVEILTMGFNSWPQGTDPWNIKNDPLAYQVILHSNAPVTIGSADVCRAHLELDSGAVKEMFGERGEIGNWMIVLFEDLISKNPQLVAQIVAPGRWVIWDIIVVAHLEGFTRITTYPRPVLNLSDQKFTAFQNSRTLSWITDMDEKSMWLDFLRKLDAFNETSAHPAKAGGGTEHSRKTKIELASEHR
jgi:purine nucleosidase